MKKYYIVFAFLFCLSAFSQNELRGEWFLYYINIEGTQQYSTIPNSINTFILDSETTFYGDVCSNSYSGSYLFNNDNTINIIDFAALGGFCSNEVEEDLFLNPYMWNILGLYTENPIYTYELNGSGENETLKLIQGNGNFAFYGRQELSLDSNLLGEWFLYSIENNNVLQENIYSQTFNIVFNEETSPNYSPLDGNAICNHYGGSYQIPSNQNQTISISLGAISLVNCNTPDENLYEDSYFSLFSYNQQDAAIFNYEISGSGNNEILVLTNEEGNIANYGRQSLSISKTLSNKLQVSLKENPVKQQLKLNLNDNIKTDLSYSIYSISGTKLVYNASFIEEIKTDLLQSGIYFLVISNTTNQQQVIKFVKE